MPSEWRQTTWGELATLEYGKSLRGYSDAPGEYRVFGTNGPIGWHSQPLCPFPSVVIGRKGAYRGVHFSPKPFFVIDTAFYLKPKVELDIRWAYYQLLMQDINGMDSGSAIPSTSREDFYGLSVSVPPLEEQRAIAVTLSTLDDKAALLRETNATLEAIAQALFRSWFVDFDPVRAKAEGREAEGVPPEFADLFPSEFEDSVLGEIPKGWWIVSIDDVADVIKGRSYKSSELVESDTALVTLKSFTRGGGFRTDGFKGYNGSYKPEQVLEPGDCVVAYTDVTQQAEVIGRAAMVLPSSKHKTLVASLDVGIVRPRIEHLTTAFMYFLLRGERYVSHVYGYTSGTTVLHLAKEGLPTYQFVLPPAALLKTFEAIAVPLMEKAARNYLQSIELASLRDTLLPKLMSGKLNITSPQTQAVVRA